MFINTITKQAFSHFKSIRNLSTSATNMTLESAKKIAAEKAVNEHVKNNTTIGIGSGSTIVYAVARLAERVRAENLNITCVPTSFQSKQLILQHNLKLGDLDTCPSLDVAIDGADECDKNLNCIKGGGGCLLQEKIVASCAKYMVIIADHSKNSEYLTQAYKRIPIEVVPAAYVPIKMRVESLFGGELKLRMAIAKAGPCVTDNGNFILDWYLTGQNSKTDFGPLNRELLMMPGIVETGLFIGMVKRAYFGMANGTVLELESPQF